MTSQYQGISFGNKFVKNVNNLVVSYTDLRVLSCDKSMEIFFHKHRLRIRIRNDTSGSSNWKQH